MYGTNRRDEIHRKIIYIKLTHGHKISVHYDKTTSANSWSLYDKNASELGILLPSAQEV